MTNARGSSRSGAPLYAALAITMLSGACGSGGGGSGADGGGGGFKAASPISNVCGLLTLADVQAIMPGAVAGVEEPTGDTTDIGFWSRICAYEDAVVTSRSLDLVIFGATTQAGLAGIKAAASGNTTNTPVSGLGTEAHYWVSEQNTNGLWALDGSTSVDVTAYFWDPDATEPQLHPLVAKAFGALK